MPKQKASRVFYHTSDESDQENVTKADSSIKKKKMYVGACPKDKSNAEKSMEGGGEMVLEMGSEADLEVNDFLQSFKGQMSRALKAKTDKMQDNMSDIMSDTYTKIRKVMDSQGGKREILTLDFVKQLNSLIELWETDVSKLKNQEESMRKALKEFTETLGNIHDSQKEKLEQLKQLYSSFSKDSAKKDQEFKDMNAEAMKEVKKKLLSLQKQVLKLTKEQEATKLKRSLNSLFY